MVKSFLVLGLGRFGTSMAKTLCSLGHDVLAVDNLDEHVNNVVDNVTRAIKADVSDEKVLANLGVRNFDCVIISVGNDIRASALSTLQCKELGAKFVIAKASDELHAKLLRNVGADRVVMPEQDFSRRLAKQLVSKNVIDFLELSDKYSIREVQIPAAWVGRSINAIDIRKKHHINVIALRRGENINVALDPAAPLLAGDLLIIVGANHDLAKVEAMPT